MLVSFIDLINTVKHIGQRRLRGDILWSQFNCTQGCRPSIVEVMRALLCPGEIGLRYRIFGGEGNGRFGHGQRLLPILGQVEIDLSQADVGRHIAWVSGDRVDKSGLGATQITLQAECLAFCHQGGRSRRIGLGQRSWGDCGCGTGCRRANRCGRRGRRAFDRDGGFRFAIGRVRTLARIRGSTGNTRYGAGGQYPKHKQ